ncbi:MAG: hypothetical protein JNM10_19360 [Planctomycetia bacterium]|nr:hypothetical protein [Planctomycetia bacterium]
MRRHRLTLLGATLALCVLTAGRAESTPTFDLHVSTAGVTHLAVGQGLQLQVYLPKVRRGASNPATPLASPVVWHAEPVDLASVSEKGVLTALRPGRVRITVEARDVPAGELPPGMPGSAQLTIVEDLAGGRLPRLEGVAAFEGFRVEWDRSGYDGNRGLWAALETFGWSVGITTKAPPKGPLPWTLDAVAERSQFNDDRGYHDLLSEDDAKRWRANLRSARLTITSWKDGVASGRFEFETGRGVALDTPFDVWMEDRDGSLARAAGTVPAEQKFTHQGWVETDRWGALWLSNGVHSVRLADELRPTVAPLVGKPVAIESRSPLRGSLPEPLVLSSIEKLRAASPRFGGRASLDLRIGAASVRPDGVQGIQLRLGYRGDEPMEFRSRDVRVLVRRVGAPIPDTALSLHDRDGSSWRPDGTSTRVLDDGKGPHDTVWVLRSPGDALRTVKGESSYGIELRLSGLPAGAYEVWATFEDLDLSQPPGVHTPRSAFDVAP